MRATHVVASCVFTCHGTRWSRDDGASAPGLCGISTTDVIVRRVPLPRGLAQQALEAAGLQSRRCRSRKWKWCEPFWKRGTRGQGYDSRDAGPRCHLRTVENWPEPGPCVGREAVMRFFEHIRDTWDADVGEPITDFSTAADRVAVGIVWRGAGHGPESNMELRASLRSARARSAITSSSGITPRRSPLPGCRSRRCRSRTWTPSDAP